MSASHTVEHPVSRANLPGDHLQLDAESLKLAVTAANLAAYRWHIGPDVIDWNADAPRILKRNAHELGSGKGYASLLDPDNTASRFDTILNAGLNAGAQDRGQGVSYQIEYQLKADPAFGFPSMWVEDSGHWYAGADGKPQLAIGVVKPITERHDHEQQLRKLSHTDALTGMMNRNRFDAALEESIAQATDEERSCALAIAAIRNLGVVNDAYGFDVANEVITAIAQRLRSMMRGGDCISRYSGSKFGIILNDISGAEMPIALERLLNAARGTVVETSHGPVWALLSIGAVQVPGHATSAATAKALAEESLSLALRQSSDNFAIHVPSPETSHARLLNARCASEITQCLKNNLFQLAFQPMVSVATGEVVCHEALLRMRDSAGETVTASHLIPVAEKLGLIRLVDRSVVQLAIETLLRHREARLSVNISATTANDPRWNEQIVTMIASAADVAGRLTIEITETIVLADLTSALQFLDKLRGIGCCVAIDDFGAGFTSFRNLRDLPVDIIKLDGSYCRNLADDPENLYFARMLIEMAHHFGIRTVAEWVETEADATILSGLGIDLIQGHFLGEPTLQPPWPDSDEAAFAFDGEPAVASAAEHVMAEPADLTALVPAAQPHDQPETDTPPHATPPAQRLNGEGNEDRDLGDAGTISHVQAESAMDIVSSLDLELDDGLARLRATLDLLNANRRSAGAHTRELPQPETQRSDDHALVFAFERQHDAPAGFQSGTQPEFQVGAEGQRRAS